MCLASLPLHGALRTQLCAAYVGAHFSSRLNGVPGWMDHTSFITQQLMDTHLYLTMTLYEKEMNNDRQGLF
jgi:hypothetical protein